MISRIAAVLAIAVVFYFLLPALAAFVQERLAARWFFKLKQEALSSGVRAVLSGVSGRNLLIKSAASGGFMPVSFAGTALFEACGEGLRKIPWRYLVSVPKGIAVFYIPPEPLVSPARRKETAIEKRLLPFFVRRKGACILFDGASGAFPLGLADPPPANSDNRLKPWFVALGAFAELALFLAFSADRELFIAAITALAAVFGKGVPYVPPGLFFTMAGNALAAKKRGARHAVFAIKAAGIALNTALFLLLAAALYG